MSENRPDSQGGGLSLGDVYFILFRQKWIILTFSMLGLLGAALVLFVLKPPQYQSSAEISIQYVVEGKSPSPPGDQLSTRTLDQQRESIINTEVATLFSFDLARQVAEDLTPQRILAAFGGGTNVDWAASVVKSGLTVEPLPDSSVIRITFQYPDPALVQPILSGVIDAYLTKYVQMHEGLGVPNSFLTNETVRLSSEIAQTSEELRRLKNAAGVISVESTEKGYADTISRIGQKLSDSEVELSEHQAVLEELSRAGGAKAVKTTNVVAAAEVPPDEVEQYRRICDRLNFYQRLEEDYLTKQGYTEENVLVKEAHGQVVQYQSLKKNLEEKYPGLTAVRVAATSPLVGPMGEATADLNTEKEQVSALRARIDALKLQLDEAWGKATNFESVKTKILELEQKKDSEEANLKYFQNNLEMTRIDEALGADRAWNIKQFQGPTPPGKGWSKTLKKKVAMMAVGGVVAGLALAFFIEMFLDRSIKRPTEIETKLRLPLFISIPDISRNGHRRLTASQDRLLLKDAEGNKPGNAGKTAPLPATGADSVNRQLPLRRFYEGLRDRLVVYFEVRNLVHKPKLIGVTSCAKGAGVSSIATGLAASLSETGEGNVLLVDMTVEGGAAQHFHKGKPNCGLESALKTETKESALVQENLYVATEPMRNEALPQVLPKRFASLISQVRGSGYDYIIFDMPPVSETTVTFRLARLMDMTLLVIEAGKTNQEVVKRVTALLAESKANVSTVLNKARSYVPTRLHQEFLDSV